MGDTRNFIKEIFEGYTPVIRHNPHTGMPEKIYYNYDDEQGGPVEVYRLSPPSNVKHSNCSTDKRYRGAMCKANQYISTVELPRLFPKPIKAYIEKALENEKQRHYNRQRYVDPDLLQGNGRQILNNEPGHWDCKQNAIAHNLNGDSGNMDCRGKVGTPREHQQMVVAPDGMIVTSDENMGTYDFVSPHGFIKTIFHGAADTVPWIIWGNSPYDKTGVRERMAGLIKGFLEYCSSDENEKNNSLAVNFFTGNTVRPLFQKTPTPWSIPKNNRNYNTTNWKGKNYPIEGFYNNWVNE